MRILVAGATGVLGRALIPVLREQGHQVIALVRDPERAAGLGVDALVSADVLDPAAVRAALGAAEPDVLVHQVTALRGPVTAHALDATARLRTEGTVNLVTAARAVGVGRIVAQSVAFAARPDGPAVLDEDAPRYLDPPDPDWARTFQAAAELERLLTGSRDLDGVVLRLGMLYGPGTAYDPDGPTGAAVRRGRLPLVGDGAGVTSFVHVADAARATARAVSAGATGVYHVTDDEPAAAADWLPAFARMLGGPPPRTVPPALAERLLGWFTAYQLTRLRGSSNARAGRDLGWRPQHPTWRTDPL